MLIDCCTCDECGNKKYKEPHDYLFFMGDARFDFCSIDCATVGLKKICVTYGIIKVEQCEEQND